MKCQLCYHDTNNVSKGNCKFNEKSKHLSAGSDKNHAGDSTWWSTKLDDFHFTER